MNMTSRIGALVIVVGALGIACKGGGSSDASSADTTASTGDPQTETGTGSETGPTGECGNAMIEEGEECDGAELGGATCMDVNPSFTGGDLVCGTSCTFDASGCTLPPGTALVTLNELTSESVEMGPFAGPNDAIELYNSGDADADLSGWTLTDEAMATVEGTYVFPDGTVLEPGEFLVLQSLDDLTGTGDFPFGISDSNVETIVLANGGVEVDAVTVDGYLARVSYCRVPDGSGAWTQCEQTFGALNLAAETPCGNGTAEGLEACDGDDLAGVTCESLGLGYSGGALACSPTCKFDPLACVTDSDLVINELDSTNDAIELFNGGDAAADLSGFILTDEDVTTDYDPMVDTAELVFGPGTVLDPGEYLVVPAGVGPGQHPFGLAVRGDSVALFDPAASAILDQVTYGDGEAMVSYCRQPNGPGGAWTAACTPTLGGAN